LSTLYPLKIISKNMKIVLDIQKRIGYNIREGNGEPPKPKKKKD